MVNEEECVEEFTVVDRRLVLCTVACGFSAFALVYDYLFPFPRSEVVLAMCAISYFILMGVLSLYSIFCEGSIFMLARTTDTTGKKPDELWTLSSSLLRFSHHYTITVTYSNGGSKAKNSCKMEKSVTEWFDEDGGLVFDKFKTDFSNLCCDAKSFDKTQ
ncbi:Probable signal peptidase complex subunit 2 [Geodia barretti]|nr:Probable signal peptidase complex subunit 2 [Geodia barretti]